MTTYTPWKNGGGQSAQQRRHSISCELQKTEERFFCAIDVCSGEERSYMNSSLRKYAPYIGTLLLWCLYAWFTIDFNVSLTARQQQWGLTQSNTVALQASIIGFYLIIWMVATHGIVLLQRRAKLFGEAHLAAGFRSIVWGLIMLLTQLILVALIGTVRPLYEADPNAIMVIATITSYIHSLFPLLGFVLIFRGVGKVTKKTPQAAMEKRNALLVTIILAVLYALLVFTNSVRNVGIDAEIRQTYYLTDWMIVLTIMLPVLIAWLYGIRSLFMLYGYRNPLLNSKGLGKLTLGIGSILASSIVLQIISSMGAERMLTIGLFGLIGLIYLFFAFLLIGFYLAIQGATHLEAEPSLSPLESTRV